MSGSDAVAFAQAQFMNDVDALEPGRFQWNGWLSPKGRVQSLFALLRLDMQTLWLVGPGVDALAPALSRYRFRSRVDIEPVPDLVVQGELGAPARARGAQLHVGPDGEVEIDVSGDAGARAMHVLPRTHAPGAGTDPDPWLALDLVHGWPNVPGAALDAWTPQQLSLDRVSAFSVRKGCYPGQEIVARTHFLGRAKRGLALFDVAGAAVGDAVTRDGSAWGEVVAVTSGTALAVGSLDDAEGAHAIDGRPASRRPLRDGLVR